MAFLGTGLLSGKKNTGSSIGGKLIESLSEGLQGLAHKKMQQRQDSENAKFWTSQGVDHQTAQALSRQPESIQKAFFERWEAPAQPSQQQVQNQQYQQPEQMQSSYTPEQANILKSIANPQERQRVAQYMQQLGNSAPSSIQNQTANEQVGNAATQQQVADKIAQGGLKPANYKAQEKFQYDKALSDYKQQRKQQHELILDEKKRNDAIEKKFKPLTDQFAQEYKTSSEIEPLLEEMISLNKEIGNWSPLKESIATSIHSKTKLDFRSTAGKNVERFRKLAAQILNLNTHAIKGIATNFKVKNLQDSLPSLSQSQEGRAEILQDLKKYAQLGQVALITEAEIRNENNGSLPNNFAELVLPRIKEKKASLLDELKGNREENTTSKLPNATEYERQRPGKGFLDKDSGKIYIAKDGKWIEYKGK